MGFYDSVKNPKLKISKKSRYSQTPDGLWKKCTSCGEIVQSQKMQDSFQVCPYCDHHFRISARERLNLIIDSDTFSSIGDGLKSIDPLKFQDKKTYQTRLEAAYEKTGVTDGTLAGVGEIDGQKVAIAIMSFDFMGGSMGVVTGEKIALVMDIAFKEKVPAIVVSCSGGARMQEGILSLMQMAKTSATIGKLKKNGIPYISVLADPTTGGCAASFAMLGDVNIAEPKALIGFAGPRVIEQTIKEVLPKGFQTSEFLLEHGMIDRIVHRHQLKSELSFFVKMFGHATK
jgi:acetyl-CoA carboxylase carboxyl transferase subunit beta